MCMRVKSGNKSTPVTFENKPKPGEKLKTLQNLGFCSGFFFSYQGIMYFQYIPMCKTVNKKNYLFVLKRLKDFVRRKRPKILFNI